jgi:hypothetical protein
MKTLPFLLFSASYALSQCQANPTPNPSDPDDLQTIRNGPVGVTGGPPSAFKFKIGGTERLPQAGYVWQSVATGKVTKGDLGVLPFALTKQSRDGCSGANLHILDQIARPNFYLGVLRLRRDSAYVSIEARSKGCIGGEGLIAC